MLWPSSVSNATSCTGPGPPPAAAGLPSDRGTIVVLGGNKLGPSSRGAGPTGRGAAWLGRAGLGPPRGAATLLRHSRPDPEAKQDRYQGPQTRHAPFKLKTPIGSLPREFSKCEGGRADGWRSIGRHLEQLGVAGGQVKLSAHSACRVGPHQVAPRLQRHCGLGLAGSTVRPDWSRTSQNTSLTGSPRCRPGAA